jgi:hypothetical protein
MNNEAELRVYMVELANGDWLCPTLGGVSIRVGPGKFVPFDHAIGFHIG